MVEQLTASHIDTIAERIKKLKGYLNIDNRRATLQKLEESTQATGFWDNNQTAQVVLKQVKEEKSYGSLYVNSKDLPFIKDVSIGDIVELTIKLKVTQLRQPDRWEVSEQKLNPKDVIVSGSITEIEKEDEKSEGK